MRQVLDNMDWLFGPWICERLGTTWYEGMGSTIGLMGEAGPVAAALYESFNGTSIMLHFAADGPVNRELCWFCSYYPFVQLGARKIISPIDISNKKSIRFIEKYGFKLETRISDATRSGDLLLYTMTKEECPWLVRGKRLRGKAQST